MIAVGDIFLACFYELLGDNLTPGLPNKMALTFRGLLREFVDVLSQNLFYKKSASRAPF